MTEDRYPLRPVGRLQDDKTPPRSIEEALAARRAPPENFAYFSSIGGQDWRDGSPVLFRRQADGRAAGHAFAEALEPLADKDRGGFFPDGIYFDGMSNPPEHLGKWERGRFVPEFDPGVIYRFVEGHFPPAKIDELRQAIVDAELGFVRELETPRRWRWYTDAAVWGLIGAALVIVIAAYWVTGP